MSIASGRLSKSLDLLKIVRDEEKAEVLNVFFASVFNNTDRPWAARFSELEDHDCGNNDFSYIGTETKRVSYTC